MRAEMLNSILSDLNGSSADIEASAEEPLRSLRMEFNISARMGLISLSSFHYENQYFLLFQCSLRCKSR